MNDDRRVLIFHAQVLITFANDVIAGVMSENLCEGGLIDTVLSTTNLGKHNAQHLMNAFLATMNHVGWDDFAELLLGPERERLEHENARSDRKQTEAEDALKMCRLQTRQQFDDLLKFVNLITSTECTHAERRGQLLMLTSKINYMQDTTFDTSDIPF